MNDMHTDPDAGKRPDLQEPAPQREVTPEEPTQILAPNMQLRDSAPLRSENVPAPGESASSDRAPIAMTSAFSRLTRRTPVSETTAQMPDASAPTTQAYTPYSAQASRGAQTQEGTQMPHTSQMSPSTPLSPAPPVSPTVQTQQRMPGPVMDSPRDGHAPYTWMPPATPGAPRPHGPSVWSATAHAAPQMSPSPAAPRLLAREKRAPSWFALIIAMVLTAAITLSASWVLMQTYSAPRSVPVSSSSRTGTTVTPVTSKGDSPDWQAVASTVSPAVVTINVEGSASSGVGSGVVYDSHGDIVTNYHVISPALDGQGKITVTLADSRLYEAEIVGTDQTTDLAVIRLTTPPEDLTVAAFGSSSDLAVGQEVMAVGAPLGLSNTVTTGIISALNRPVEVSNTDSRSTPVDPNDPFGQLPQFQNRSTSSSDSVITNAIQVDASINPGNSGGPLFDSTGKVIGINSSIASNTGSEGQAGSIGLGFAIPVDLVSSITQQLITTGSADHAVLGVTVQSAAAQLDGAAVAGAKVIDVAPGGGAEKAGLASGDVIVAINGESVSSSKQLTGYVRRYKGGDEITVTYVRDGHKYEVPATLSSQKK